MNIGADLRQPLFVGMRASFVPDTLTFSRKHSCLHSCSLGRDTHYSPLPLLVSFRHLCPPAFPPCVYTSPSRFPVLPPLDAVRAHLNAHTYTRAFVSRERRLNASLSVQTRMRVRLESKRWWTTSPFFALSPFPHFCPRVPPGRPLPLGCARCVTFVCVSGIYYDRARGGEGRGSRRERGGEAGGGTVPGNSGSRSGTGGGKRLSRWLLVAHWRCTPEAFDLSLSPSAAASARPRFRSVRLSRYLSPSHLSIPPLFPLTQPGLPAPSSPSFASSRASSPCSSWLTTRANPHTYARARAQNPPIGSFHSVSARLVRSRLFPLRPSRSSPPDHSGRRFSSFSPRPRPPPP